MPAAKVIRAPAGLGKTSLVVKGLAKGQFKYAEVYVPTHALAQEIERELKKANPNLRVNVIAGRSHVGTSGVPMCAKHTVAEELARVGASIYASMCERKQGTGFQRCQHYAACPYIQQFTAAEVSIYTHAHLPLRRTKLEQGVPEFVVIDESFFQTCIEIFRIPIALLHAAPLGPVGQRICSVLEQALVHGKPVLQELRDAAIGTHDFTAWFKELRGQRAKVNPSMNGQQQAQAARALGDTHRLRKLAHCVVQELWTERKDSHGLTYDPVTAEVTVHLRKRITRLSDPNPGLQPAVLVIDGSANPEIIGRFMRVARYSKHQATRRARVVQCISTRCSTTSLVPQKNRDAKSARAARMRLKQLEKFIAGLASRHARVLVVGPQTITGNAASHLKPLINVPPNVDLAHFNAIRGIDRWKHHDAVVIIGRNEPPIKAVEAIARAVYLADRVPLNFANDWVTEMRGYRLHGRRVGISVVRHPDPRVQAILEQLREAESEQAIDRLRLIHATAAKVVYVLSNLPLDLDVDELLDWDVLMEGARLEQAFSQCPGVLPLAPAWLAQRFPHLWKTRAGAERDIGRWRKDRQITNMNFISNLPVFDHAYRPAASTQRAWSVCMSTSLDVEVTRIALEGLLDAPVTMRVEGGKRQAKSAIAAGSPGQAAGAPAKIACRAASLIAASSFGRPSAATSIRTVSGA